MLDRSAKPTGYRWQQAPTPAAQLIGWLCQPGGLVLDPFAGTGSYGAAALSAGRRFVGVEADRDRYTACVDRLEQLTC
jgi:site-specific DNA-methyltransferase (adenine-specific)